jgi:hypothetical protein
MTECPIECMNRDLICESPASFLEKNGTFVLTLVGIISTGIGIVFTYFLKSRCTEIKCFGLFCKRHPLELDVSDVEITSASVTN